MGLEKLQGLYWLQPRSMDKGNVKCHRETDSYIDSDIGSNGKFTAVKINPPTWMNLMKIIYKKGTPGKKMYIMSHLDNIHQVYRVKSVNVGAAARRARGGGSFCLGWEGGREWRHERLVMSPPPLL